MPTPETPTSPGSRLEVALTAMEEKSLHLPALPATSNASIGPLTLDFSVGAQFERATEMLHFTFGLRVHAAQTSALSTEEAPASGQLAASGPMLLIEMTTLFVFTLTGATAQFDADPTATGPAWMRFPVNLREMLISTAYATSRGVLFGHLSGTSLRSFVLPLIAPEMITQLAIGAV